MPFSKEMFCAAILNWRLAYVNGECADIAETDARPPEHVAREIAEYLWKESNRLQAEADNLEREHAATH